MSFEVLLVLGTALGLGVGGWVCRALLSARARARRQLRRAPRVRIARAPDGARVKLVGTLRLSEPAVTAPLCGRPCAHFHTTVEQQKPVSGGFNASWNTIVSESGHCNTLWLEDGTGRALVELVELEVVLTMDNHFSSGFLENASPELEAFLARHGMSSQGWVFNKTLRYREGLLEPGERVAVLGTCRWEPDPDPAAANVGGLRQPAIRLRVLAPRGGPLLLSDEMAVRR